MIRRQPEAMRAVMAWWRDLQPDPGRGARGDRAGAARLRHAGTVLEASLQPATIGLCRSLNGKPRDMNHVALLAAVLADLREDSQVLSIARALGGAEKEARPCSPLRFQLLLQAAELDAQLTAFRRALGLLKHRGHVADLAASLLDWNDPVRREARLQRWLYDYYDTENPDPSTRPGATQ